VLYRHKARGLIGRPVPGPALGLAGEALPAAPVIRG
jgi:hypothetical protein